MKILYSAVKWMMGKSMKLFHIYRMAKSSLEKHLYGFSSLENFGEQNSEFEKSLSLNAAPQYKQIPSATADLERLVQLCKRFLNY